MGKTTFPSTGCLVFLNHQRYWNMFGKRLELEVREFQQNQTIELGQPIHFAGYCYWSLPLLSFFQRLPVRKGSRYHEDLSVIEQLGLLLPGAVVVADNVLKPGSPLFLWRLCKGNAYENHIAAWCFLFHNWSKGLDKGKGDTCSEFGALKQSFEGIPEVISNFFRPNKKRAKRLQ